VIFESLLAVHAQFRLSELERTVVLQIWTKILANTTLLAAFDYNVDDGLDEREPGLLKECPLLIIHSTIAVPVSPYLYMDSISDLMYDP